MLFTHNCRHQFFFSSFLCTWSLPTNPHFCLKAAPKAWGGDSLLLREERGDIQERDRVPPSFLPAPPPDKESTSTLLPFPLVLPLRRLCSGVAGQESLVAGQLVHTTVTVTGGGRPVGTDRA